MRIKQTILVVAMSALFGSTLWAQPLPTRLGLKGRVVVVVTASSAAGLEAGDVIVDIVADASDAVESEKQPVRKCGEGMSSDALEHALGKAVRVEFLQRDRDRGTLSHHTLVARMPVHLGEQLPRKLGVNGRIGFLVEDIEPNTAQSQSLRPGDIIVSTDLAGPFTDIEKLRSLVRASRADSLIRAEILRFDPGAHRLESKMVPLRTSSYVSYRLPDTAAYLDEHAGLASSTSLAQSCPDNPCSWCCAMCVPYPWSRHCNNWSPCETGMYRCQTVEVGRCKGIIYCF